MNNDKNNSNSDLSLELDTSNIDNSSTDVKDMPTVNTDIKNNDMNEQNISTAPNIPNNRENPTPPPKSNSQNEEGEVFIDGLPEPEPEPLDTSIEDNGNNTNNDDSFDDNFDDADSFDDDFNDKKDKKSFLKDKKKILLTGSAVAAILLIAGGAYFMMPTQNSPYNTQNNTQITNNNSQMQLTGIDKTNDNVNFTQNETDGLSATTFDAPPQPDNSFAEPANEFEGVEDPFAVENNVATDDLTDIAPPPLKDEYFADDNDNDIDIVNIDDGAITNDIYDDDITTANIDDIIEENNPTDGSSLPTPEADIEAKSIEFGEDTVSKIEEVTNADIIEKEEDSNNIVAGTVDSENNVPPMDDISVIDDIVDKNLEHDLEISNNIEAAPSQPAENMPEQISLINEAPPTVPVMPSVKEPVKASQINQYDDKEITPPTDLSKGELQTGENEDIRKTLKELPTKEAIIRPLPKKYLIMKHKHPKPKEMVKIKAEKALKQGNAGAALGLLEKAERISPKDTNIIFKQAVAYQQMGNFDAALKQYERILKINPANLDALTNMLGILKERSPNLALRKLKELREIYPDNAGIAAQLSVVYGRLKHYSEAIKYLDIASGLDEPNAYYAFNKAVYLDHLGRRGEATEMYKQALTMHFRGMTGKQPIPIAEIKKRLNLN